MSKVTLNNVGDLTQTSTAQSSINNNLNIIQTAFDNTLSRDGTSPNQMSSNLDMNSNHIFNLPAPISANDAVRFQDLSTLQAGGTITPLPAGGTTGQVLQKHSNTNYDVQWGSGIVSSVGLSLPADFTVTNSPVTSTGTLTATFVASPTGTGGFVRSTSPTITTGITVPLVIGGTAAGSTLTLKSTSNGSPSADNVNIVVGGAERARITSNGTNSNFLVGTTTNLQTDMVAAFKGSGSGIFTIGQQPGATQYVTFFAAPTPSATNYLFEADSSGVDPVLYFNAPTASGAIRFQTNAGTKMTLQPSGGLAIGTTSDPGTGGIFANVAAGIGTNTIASSFLVIAIGTTAKAQINFGSTGVAPTSPNNGDFWFDGTNFKARIGGVTKTFTVA